MQQLLFDNLNTAAKVQVDPAFVDRDYQARAIQGAFECFERGDRGAMVRAFTGAGKTYIGSRIVEKWLNLSDRRRVFVCAHERQLVTQFRDELQEFLRIPVGLEMSSDGRVSFNRRSPRVIVSCRATLQKDKDGLSRLHKFDPWYEWLLILDEAHRWAYTLPSCRHVLEWFEKNPAHRRLCLTATPDRSDGISLQRIAPGIALDYPMFSASGPSAIEDGWAVPFDQRFIHVEGVDFQNLKEVAGDFDKNELEKILQEREQLAAMIKPLLDLVGNRRTLIFNAGVDLAKAVARSINAEYREGAAQWLDGSVRDEIRKQVFQQHQNGQFQFLSVCGLCREGYNDPGIQCVAIFRPTKSSGLAEQMIGRGCRPLKGVVDGVETPSARREAIAASGKPNCMIVDLVGATGLGQCATTAHLYAIGQDDIPADELTEKANQHLLEEDGGDIGEAVKKARDEIAEEREKARLAREEAERREIERKKREARIQANVRYQTTQGTPGSGSAPSTMSFTGDPATEKQIDYMVRLGVTEEFARQCSKKQASAVIGKLKARKNPDGPAHPNQIRVLKKFDRYSDGLSYEEAAQRIREINETVLS